MKNKCFLLFSLLLLFLSSCQQSTAITLTKEETFLIAAGLDKQDNINHSAKFEPDPRSTQVHVNEDIDISGLISVDVLPLKAPQEPVLRFFIYDETQKSWRVIPDISEKIYPGDGILEAVIPGLNEYPISDGGIPDPTQLGTLPVHVRVLWAADQIKDGQPTGIKVGGYVDVEIIP